MEDSLWIEREGSLTYATKGRKIGLTVTGYKPESTGKTPSRQEELNLSNPWMPWGRNNKFPLEVMEDLRQSTVGKRILSERAKVHVGTDLLYYMEEVDEEGHRTKVPLYIPEIEDWLEENDVWQKQKAIAEDLETFYNAWPELVLSRDNSKIAGYGHRKAVFCRMERANKDTGRIDHTYFSYDWPTPQSEKHYRKLWNFDTEDPFKDAVSVLPLKYSTPDAMVYYELAIWDSVRQNGWMSIDRMVPKLKESIFKNQAVLKYHVKIPAMYFELKHGKEKWMQMDAKAKQGSMNDELEKMDTFLSGVENSGKAYVSVVQYVGGQKFDFEIEALENKLAHEAYLPDASAAYSAILFAMGYDPTLIGANLIDKRSSGGSGSDKRESLGNLQMKMPVDRNVSLKPLRIVTKVNKWNDKYAKTLGGKRIKWAYVDVERTTLDKNPTGQSNVVQ
jgi:hypothetical protein